MEAICSSETSINFQRTTRRYNPEDKTLRMPRAGFICSVSDGKTQVSPVIRSFDLRIFPVLPSFDLQIFPVLRSLYLRIFATKKTYVCKMIFFCKGG
jgi:hypothetical protein